MPSNSRFPNAVPTPVSRVFDLNGAPVRTDGAYVVYWMVAQRRPRANFALQRAVECANALGVPLVVFEPLRVGYRWASDRHHQFVIDGMRDHVHAFGVPGCRYVPYVERHADEGRGLLEVLAADASCVVTDWFPAFFLPRMVRSAAARLPVRVEAVDSNGVVPLAATPKAFTRAHDFRRFLHKQLRPHLAAFPERAPLEALVARTSPTLPSVVEARWGRLDAAALDTVDLRTLPIDHQVGATATRGGSAAGRALAERFVRQRLASYPEERNHPDAGGGSGLSPYLHFGHVGVHEVLELAFEQAAWTPEQLATTTQGQREGWWNAGEALEAFLDELITWRELGYGFCHHRQEDYDAYESLPTWALQTLSEHASDPRPVVYTLSELANAETHDALWNAAQRELVQTGRMHNYLRMLWGKKVLEWSPTAEVALAHLVELNNRYALDGRDPNSYSGIFWTFGRFDRAWGPERPIYGKVRYMTSDSTRRKLKLTRYLTEFGPEGRQGLLL
jgi:deoxyribodipyrimidine photo-lyase